MRTQKMSAWRSLGRERSSCVVVLLERTRIRSITIERRARTLSPLLLSSSYTTTSLSSSFSDLFWTFRKRSQQDVVVWKSQVKRDCQPYPLYTLERSLFLWNSRQVNSCCCLCTYAKSTTEGVLLSSNNNNKDDDEQLWLKTSSFILRQMEEENSWSSLPDITAIWKQSSELFRSLRHHHHHYEFSSPSWQKQVQRITAGFQVMRQLCELREKTLQPQQRHHKNNNNNNENDSLQQSLSILEYSAVLDETALRDLCVAWRDCILHPTKSIRDDEFETTITTDFLTPQYVVEQLNSAMDADILGPHHQKSWVILYNIVFHVLKKKHLPQEARQLYHQLFLSVRKNKLFPTFETVTEMAALDPIRANHYLGHLQELYRIHQKNDFKPTPQLYCTVMEAYSLMAFKQQHHHQQQQLQQQQLETKNTTTTTTQTCLEQQDQNNSQKKALQKIQSLWEEMKQFGQVVSSEITRDEDDPNPWAINLISYKRVIKAMIRCGPQAIDPISQFVLLNEPISIPPHFNNHNNNNNNNPNNESPLDSSSKITPITTTTIENGENNSQNKMSLSWQFHLISTALEGFCRAGYIREIITFWERLEGATQGDRDGKMLLFSWLRPDCFAAILWAYAISGDLPKARHLLSQYQKIVLPSHPHHTRPAEDNQNGESSYLDWNNNDDPLTLKPLFAGIFQSFCQQDDLLTGEQKMAVDRAIAFLPEMNVLPVKPDAKTFIALIMVALKHCSPEQTELLFLQMKKLIRPSPSIFRLRLKVWLQAGHAERVSQVLLEWVDDYKNQRLKQPPKLSDCNTALWSWASSSSSSSANHSRGEKAAVLFRQLFVETALLSPNTSSYNAVIAAYSQDPNDAAEKVWELWNELQQQTAAPASGVTQPQNLQPDLTTYTEVCVALLCDHHSDKLNNHDTTTAKRLEHLFQVLRLDLQTRRNELLLDNHTPDNNNNNSNHWRHCWHRIERAFLNHTRFSKDPYLLEEYEQLEKSLFSHRVDGGGRGAFRRRN